jgi:hypothetical protein
MNQLGHFEQNLLTELREVVAEQATTPEPRRALPPQRRLAVAAGVLAAGLLVGIPAMDSEQLPAAYAVATHDDGTIDITVNRLEDPDGLERELATRGVTAVVDFSPPGKQCAEADRYDRTRNPLLETSVGVARPEDTITLRRTDLEGRTLHLWGRTERGFPEGKGYFLTYTIVYGPVAPCVVIDISAN